MACADRGYRKRPSKDRNDQVPHLALRAGSGPPRTRHRYRTVDLNIPLVWCISATGGAAITGTATMVSRSPFQHEVCPAPIAVTLLIR